MQSFPLAFRGLRPAQRSARISGAGMNARRHLALYERPNYTNEPSPEYATGSPELAAIEKVYKNMRANMPYSIPLKISGQEIKKTTSEKQIDPSDKAVVAEWTPASKDDIKTAIDAALKAKPAWESLPFQDRAGIFYRAAELLSTKYRLEYMAATMLGQGKNIREAEIDAAEGVDLFRFNVHSAFELFERQPAVHPPGMWNRMEYRPLEGFVYAVSPFNYTALGATLAMGPLLMGNVVIWKPSPLALHSGWLLYKILLEAGLPKDVLQFVPGDAAEVTDAVLESEKFAGLNFTGSSAVFRSLIAKIGAATGENRFISYPRIVGETGGKNFHLIHNSADLENAIDHTIRGAFEYAGQKCASPSRVYVPESKWPEFKDSLLKKVAALKTGPSEDRTNFVNAMINEPSYNRVMGIINKAKKDPNVTLLAGGDSTNDKGYYINPTIFQTSDPKHELMTVEVFGPMFAIYVYPDADWAKMPELVDTTSKYALTGSIFAKDAEAIRIAEDGLKHSAGNFYINTKSTGSVVGQQPFGGSRASGTNDKVGSAGSLGRFVSIRTIKEDFVPIKSYSYPNFESS